MTPSLVAVMGMAAELKAVAKGDGDADADANGDMGSLLAKMEALASKAGGASGRRSRRPSGEVPTGNP